MVFQFVQCVVCGGGCSQLFVVVQGDGVDCVGGEFVIIWFGSGDIIVIYVFDVFECVQVGEVYCFIVGDYDMWCFFYDCLCYLDWVDKVGQCGDGIGCVCFFIYDCGVQFVVFCCVWRGFFVGDIKVGGFQIFYYCCDDIDCMFVGLQYIVFVFC